MKLGPENFTPHASVVNASRYLGKVEATAPTDPTVRLYSIVVDRHHHHGINCE
jgi:hypothetical protein